MVVSAITAGCQQGSIAGGYSHIAAAGTRIARRIERSAASRGRGAFVDQGQRGTPSRRNARVVHAMRGWIGRAYEGVSSPSAETSAVTMSTA